MAAQQGTAMWRTILTLVLGSSLLWALVVVTAGGRNGEAAAEPERDLLQLKLIPYHAQRRRRRRERELRRLKEGEAVDSNDLDDDLSLHKDRPHQYPRRQRQLDALEGTPKQVAELFQGYGTHYVDLWLGEPDAQRQTVIVDTGSGVTAFPCTGCENCGVPKYHSDGLFDQTKSTSFKKLNCNECLRGHCVSRECRISMSYQEGSSWSAFESQDSCYAGGLHSGSVSDKADVDEDDLNPFLAAKFSFPMKFGCQTHLTGLFITQLADGIMGLDNAEASYVQQMEKAGKIPNKSFALCYSRQDSVDPKGTESGAFTLGGTDDRMHKSPMVWTNTGGRGGFYAVKVRNMYMRSGNSGDSAQSSDPNAKVVPLGASADTYARGQVIVDSGTTDTYFARTIGSKFGALFEQMSTMKYGHSKQTLTLDEVKALPTILIQLWGDEALNKQTRDAAGQPVVGLAEEVDPEHPYDVLLAIPPTHYMEYDEDEKGWTNRFYTDEPSGGVIGGNAMMGHDVYFDVDNGRLGWAEADCGYTALVKQYGFSTTGGGGSAPSRQQVPAPIPTPAPVQAPHAEPAHEPAQEPSPISETIDTTDDDEGGASTLATGQFCSSLMCQGALVSTLVLVVVMVAVRAAMRRGRGYELSDGAASELELQDAAGAVGGDGVIRYRDEPEEEDEEGVTHVS